jgi:hypothetical protein
VYRLVGLAEVLVTDVSGKLAALVERNAERLTVDFPNVTKYYAGHQQATGRLYHLQEEMGLAAGRYGAYVVYYDHQPVGMATYSMYTTWFWVPGKGFAWISGPLLSGWLDQHRPAQAKRKSAEVLRLLAREAAAEEVVTGHAWSVVRPENRAAIRALEAVDNGFGSFVPIGRPRSYHGIDSVRAPRQLCVANFSMNALRPAKG